MDLFCLYEDIESMLWTLVKYFLRPLSQALNKSKAMITIQN